MDPQPPRPLRVAVAIPTQLDRLAYSALLASAAEGVAVVEEEASDVRLADRCAAGRAPTVVLGESGCGCCADYPRDGGVTGLLAQLRTAAGLADEATPPSHPALVMLTRRERDVLKLVGQGYTVPQCAEALGVTRSTIGNHKYRLMRKLGVTTSLQLLRIAVRWGLAPID